MFNVRSGADFAIADRDNPDSFVFGTPGLLGVALGVCSSENPTVENKFEMSSTPGLVFEEREIRDFMTSSSSPQQAAPALQVSCLYVPTTL